MFTRKERDKIITIRRRILCLEGCHGRQSTEKPLTLVFSTIGRSSCLRVTMARTLYVCPNVNDDERLNEKMSTMDKLVERKKAQFVRDDAQLLHWALDKGIKTNLGVARDAFGFARLSGNIEGQRRISFRIEENETGIVDFCIRNAEHPRALERFKAFAKKYWQATN